MFLDLLHAQQHDDGLVAVVTGDAQVLAHRLDVADGIGVDAHDFVVALDEDDVIVGAVGRDFGCRLLAYLVDVAHLLGSSLKLVKAVGLQQVAHSIGLVALDGIFGIGSREDHNGATGVVLLDRFGKVYAVEVGHVDVEEDSLNLLLLNHLFGFGGTAELAHEFKVGYLLDVGHQFPECQRFIVNCNTFNHSLLLF